MSDLLMKNEEMPQACENCYIASCICYRNKNDKKGYWACMSILDEDNSIEDALDRGERSSKCPLVEVKPHGKLKDFNDILTIFDKVIHDVDDKTNALLCDLLVQIQYAPTVLEATNE